jgi:hypothetical protein
MFARTRKAPAWEPYPRQGAGTAHVFRAAAFGTFPHSLAAADGSDDLDAIARCQPALRKAAARHDFVVDLDGQSLTTEIKTLEQRGHVNAVRDLGGITVDDNLHD